MIKFFRQSYAVQYVVIVLLAIALWIPAFVSGTSAADSGSLATPIFNLLDGWFGASSIGRKIFALLLLIFEALIFNAMLVNNKIIGKVSTMGGFVFVLMMSLTETQTDFYPFALACVFILLVISNLFEVYQLQNPEIGLLKVGILVALASMCYFPSILLVLWVMIALPIAKKGSFRLELIPISGFLFTYFCYFVGVYLFGNLLTVLQSYRDGFLMLQLSIEGFNYKNIILLAFLLLTSVAMLLGSPGLEKTFSVRLKMSIVILLLLVSIIMLFFAGNVIRNGLIFLLLAIIFSYVFSYMSNTGLADLVLALCLLLVFANHYYFKIL